MKAVLMAGGFSKRLLSIAGNKSKCLIEIGGKPIIDYTINKLNEIPEIDEIIVITNETFFEDFVNWSKTHSFINIRIMSDGGTAEDSKIGALTALLNFLEKENIDEDLFLAGADNFFKFSLRNIFEMFKRENKDLSVFYDIGDLEKAKRFGVAILDEKNLVLNFEEKPENPKSNLVVTGLYIYPPTIFDIIDKLEYSQRGELEITDVNNILIKREQMMAHIINGEWSDAGTFDSLIKTSNKIQKSIGL